MRHWTPEERAKQAEKIREWQPWKTAGVKTAAGKARSSRNALKHGGFTKEMQFKRRYLRHTQLVTRAVKLFVKGGPDAAYLLPEIVESSRRITAEMIGLIVGENHKTNYNKNEGIQHPRPSAELVIPAQAGIHPKQILAPDGALMDPRLREDDNGGLERKCQTNYNESEEIQYASARHPCEGRDLPIQSGERCKRDSCLRRNDGGEHGGFPRFLGLVS